jgi:hypothetical protein
MFTMNTFVSNQKKEVNKKLAEIEKEEADIVKKSSKSAQVLNETLKELKTFTLDNGFENENAEIRFFKETKPWFAYQLIYHRGIYSIESRRPQGLTSDIIKYLQSHIEAIDRENIKYMEFNTYYHLGSTSLDEKFFLRGQDESIWYQDSFSHELDPRFSTHFDHHVAKFQANNQMLAYLKTEVEMLEMKNNLSATLPKVRLTWMDTKTTLSELIHALYCVGVFGQATLMEISQYFEAIFNIDLDKNMSRTLCDMRDRNNPVSFLDKLRSKLLERMTSGIQTKNRNKR